MLKYTLYTCLLKLCNRFVWETGPYFTLSKTLHSNVVSKPKRTWFRMWFRRSHVSHLMRRKGRCEGSQLKPPLTRMTVMSVCYMMCRARKTGASEFWQQIDVEGVELQREVLHSQKTTNHNNNNSNSGGERRHTDKTSTSTATETSTLPAGTVQTHTSAPTLSMLPSQR